MSAFRPALPFQKLQTIFVCWGPRRSINDVNLGSKPWRGYGLRMVRETQRFEHRERRSVVDVGGRSCLSNHEIFRKKRADNDICPICTLEIFDDINSNTPLCIKHNNQYLPYPLKGVKRNIQAKNAGQISCSFEVLGEKVVCGRFGGGCVLLWRIIPLNKWVITMVSKSPK